MARNGTAARTRDNWRAWSALLATAGMLMAANACSGSTDSQGDSEGNASGGSGPTSTQGSTAGATTTGRSTSVTVSAVTGGAVTTNSSVSVGGAPSTTGTAQTTDGGIGGDAGDSGEGNTTSAGTGGSAGESSVTAGQGGAAGAASDNDGPIAACEDGQAASCPGGTPLCATRNGAGTSGTSGGVFISDFTDYSFCTQECESAGDCEFDMTGVTAEVLCAQFNGSNASVCSLDCSFGRTCPEGMVCYSNTCMFEHRTCSCTGNCDGTECD